MIILVMPSLFMLMVKIGKSFNWIKLLVISFGAVFIVLFRPTNVIVLMVIPVYWFIIKKWSFAQWLSRSLILGIIPAIFVLGWMLKNYQDTGSFYFALSGHRALLNSYNTNVVPGVKKWPIYPQEIQQRLDDASSVDEETHIMKEEVSKFLKYNKIKAVQIALMNCVNYWNPFPLTYRNQGMAASKYKKFLALPYIFYLVLGLLGFLKYRKNPLFQAFVLMMGLNTLFNAPIMVSIRYRVIIDFTFILMAAAYLHSIIYFDYTSKREPLKEKPNIQFFGAKNI
jgi:hypothetical protein